MALENRLGINDSAELAKEEERISKKKALEMFQTGFLDELNQNSCSRCSLACGS